MEIWVFRWVILRMPILSEDPRFKEEHGATNKAEVGKWTVSAS
jgi:hypothetical protein